MPEFFISDSAAKRIHFLANKETMDNPVLRIEVLGGGCSGFQYHYDFDQQKDGDLVFTHHDATVVIDETSIQFVDGSQIDYVETLGASAFEIKNPNASANCGCGNSFSV